MSSRTRLFDGARCFPIEDFIVLYPVAVFALFNLVFGTFVYITKKMSAEIQRSFIVYLYEFFT